MTKIKSLNDSAVNFGPSQFRSSSLGTSVNHPGCNVSGFPGHVPPLTVTDPPGGSLSDGFHPGNAAANHPLSNNSKSTNFLTVQGGHSTQGILVGNSQQHSPSSAMQNAAPPSTDAHSSMVRFQPALSHAMAFSNLGTTSNPSQPSRPYNLSLGTRPSAGSSIIPVVQQNAGSYPNFFNPNAQNNPPDGLLGSGFHPGNATNTHPLSNNANSTNFLPVQGGYSTQGILFSNPQQQSPNQAMQNAPPPSTGVYPSMVGFQPALSHAMAFSNLGTTSNPSQPTMLYNPAPGTQPYQLPGGRSTMSGGPSLGTLPSAGNSTTPIVQQSAGSYPNFFNLNAQNNPANFSYPGSYHLDMFNLMRQHEQSLFKAMSNHMIEESLSIKGITKFSGESYNFWSWASKIMEYIQDLNLSQSPRKIAHLLEAYTEGEPLKTVSNMLAATSSVTIENIHEIWNELILLYADPKKIALDLTRKLDDLDNITEANAGHQLSRMHRLCRIVQFNIPNCPDLSDLNIAKGIRNLRAKLPLSVQIECRNRVLLLN